MRPDARRTGKSLHFPGKMRSVESVCTCICKYVYGNTVQERKRERDKERERRRKEKEKKRVKPEIALDLTP